MSSLDDNLVPIALACYFKVKTRKRKIWFKQCFFFFFFMNGNTEQAQCALSLVCIPQEMEKSKTSL